MKHKRMISAGVLIIICVLTAGMFPVTGRAASFFGRDDVLMQGVDMNSWSRFTKGRCGTYGFSGGHFYYAQHKEEICRIIAEKLHI